MNAISHVSCPNRWHCFTDFHHLPTTWSTFASQMGAFLPVGGVRSPNYHHCSQALHNHTPPTAVPSFSCHSTLNEMSLLDRQKSYLVIKPDAQCLTLDLWPVLSNQPASEDHKGEEKEGEADSSSGAMSRSKVSSWRGSALMHKGNTTSSFFPPVLPLPLFSFSPCYLMCFLS